MRSVFAWVFALLGAVALLPHFALAADNNVLVSTTDNGLTPDLNNGLTKAVTWDQYSLSVNGKRVYILAAEFHYQRLPVPELWLDVFQKFKAEGYNTVNIYFFWSYHAARQGAYDFTTSGKDIQRMFDYARQAGLYIITRPGPYCNAETNGGGLALYLSDGSGGNLRTSDPTYYAQWLPWITYVGQIIAANQITKGGPVILNQIENELQESYHIANYTLVVYMEQIEAAARAAGITIPSTSNEKGMRSESWSTDYQNVGGAVNVYGLDSYPGGTSCTNPSSGFNVVNTYYQWFQNYSYTQPEFLPEFEGGYIRGWNTSFYDDCQSELSYNFPDLYYKNNIGQRVTLLSIYMSYGGTNWGNSGAPVVYTSYDYSAPLRETRQIRDKLFHIKLIGLMTRVSSDLLHTTMIGNGTGYTNGNTSIMTWELRNKNNNAAFYTVLQAKSSSQTFVSFSLNVTTSKGARTIPNISLDGRQSKIIVTDYHFGSHTLLYSSAEVLTYGVFGKTNVLVLYLNVGQYGQLAFKSNGANPKFTTYGAPTNFAANGERTAYSYTQGSGTSFVEFNDGTIFVLMDRVTAYNFHAPATTLDPNVPANDQIFVWGPYLVRSATIAAGSVSIVGDANVTTPIEVYAGPNAQVSNIKWNGVILPTTKTAYGSLVASVAGAESRNIVLPALTGWKTNNTLPELDPAYDDSNWMVCNKNSTRSPIAPLTYPVLFSSDYGFYTGMKIYRARFTGTNATAGNITAQNGFGSGWTAWINGHLVATVSGNSALTATNAVFNIDHSILVDGTNVMTVVVDYHGHDETSTSKGVENPRGILGATLTGATFAEWRIQGNAGGNLNLDPVRGPMNEGGLYGERVGWHLPGFDASGWEDGSPLDGIAQSGIQWYLTNFTLNFDADLDVPIGLAFSVANSTVPIRVRMWINGYNYALYIPTLGPQTVFPFQPGVVNNRGSNTLALSLWAQTDAGASLASAQLVQYGAYVSGFNFNQDWSYLQPGWDEGRLAYA